MRLLRAPLLLLAAALLVASAAAGQPLLHQVVTLTTDSAGDGIAYTATRISRQVVFVWYQGGLVEREEDKGFVLREDSGRIVRDDGFDLTADLAITCESTSEGLWTESNVADSKAVAPSTPLQDQVGVDRTQYDYVWCMSSRVRIAVAQGGNARTGVFTVVSR